MAAVAPAQLLIAAPDLPRRVILGTKVLAYKILAKICASTLCYTLLLPARQSDAKALLLFAAKLAAKRTPRIRAVVDSVTYSAVGQAGASPRCRTKHRGLCQ